MSEVWNLAAKDSLLKSRTDYSLRNFLDFYSKILHMH